MISWVTALIDLFKVLPALLNMIQSLTAWLKKVSGNNPQDFIVKAGNIFDNLAAAKTPEEHSQAAQDLANLIRGLK